MSTTHLLSNCTMVSQPETVFCFNSQTNSVDSTDVITVSSLLSLMLSDLGKWIILTLSICVFVAFQTEGKLYLILDFLRGGDLFTRLSKEVSIVCLWYMSAFFSFFSHKSSHLSHSLSYSFSFLAFLCVYVSPR